MSDYTEELLKNLSIIGSASHRIMNAAVMERKAPAQQLVLDILIEEDGLTQGVLAELLDIRPSSLTEVLNKLEAKGEIRRREDPKDKRIKQVFITEEGRAKATPANERQDRSEEFFAGLSEEELKQLDQLLNKIVSGWLEDFCDIGNVPRSPLETLGSLKEMKKHFKKEFMGKDMGDMTMEERRQLKTEMKKFMRQFGHPLFSQHRRGFDPRLDPEYGFRNMNANDCDKRTEDGWDDW